MDGVGKWSPEWDGRMGKTSETSEMDLVKIQYMTITTFELNLIPGFLSSLTDKHALIILAVVKKVDGTADILTSD